MSSRVKHKTKFRTSKTQYNDSIKRNYYYRDVQKVFGHCNIVLYISYKTTFL